MKRTVWGYALALLMLCGCGRESAPVAEGDLQEDVGEKEEIVLVATDQIGNILQEFITEYNQQSEDYYITYEELFDTPQGYESAVNRLNARLVSGDSPDLVIINYNLFQVYLEAEALEDLSPYLYESHILKREDYLEKAISPFEQDGGLYGVPVAFTLQTLLAGGAGQKAGPEWGIENFLEYMETNRDIVFEWSGNSFEILKFCLQYGIDGYVDYDAGTCRFDSEEFAQLLRRTEKLGETVARQSRPWYEVVEEGGTLITEQSIDSFTGLVKAGIRYENTVEHLGYPGADGMLKCRMLPDAAIGLAANSENKEAAWEILEQYLCYPFELYEFPAKRKDFEELFQAAITRQYAAQEDGSREEQPVAYYRGEPIYALTGEQADAVLEAIEAAEPDNAARSHVRSIVLEEAQAYFNGQKTLEEVQRLMQSRVRLYLSEQK